MNKRQKKTVSVDNLTDDSRRITRSMSLSKNGNENSLPFPIDIINMIFLKLSLKSIARCRCVSKLWAIILRRSDFTELFLKRSSSRGPKHLVSFRNQTKLCIFSSPQPQDSCVVSNYQMKFSLNSFFEDCQYVYGLICLKDIEILKKKKEMVLKIFNPSTRQVLILPKLKTRRFYVWSVFGYDPIGKQFKVLAMTVGVKHGGMCDEFQVMTVGSGYMSWKMIDCIPHHSPDRKICINGVIYYTSYEWHIENYIVCFDVRFEKFNFIKATEIMNSFVPNGVIIDMINYNGKLGLLFCERDVNYQLFDGRSKNLRLWVLEDLEKQVWSNHSFLLPSMPENIVEKVSLYFVGMTQTNEIVLSSLYSPYSSYLFYLNLENKTVIRVTIQATEAPEYGRYYVFPDHVEDVKLYANV